ncbi:hypothetical protein C2E21_6232 [Chlorella sorokiniana]|uniref:Uncharacterized protein n=1 Tax=Chlorella sorokiniana TaxID=3076 RepID=A0A2P6TKM8_CHLSO|nr:hypothetical protein C2E21_6232 [Chlorella sorokiniana]|eukprot:PRW44852.1 hypothetical protein C2E21_6232 [Chlorella sorokiniana]
MASAPAPRARADSPPATAAAGESAIWTKRVTPTLWKDNKLLFPVVQLRSWGCLLEEGAPTGPKLKVRCLSRVTGLMPTMSSPFHLNPPSDLGKRPACSMPASIVKTLLLTFKADVKGCFAFRKSGWEDGTLVLNVTYEPPAVPLPTASEAGAASALGRLHATGGATFSSRGAQPASGEVIDVSEDSDSEEDEPLVNRVNAARKRSAPAQPAARGPAAKQARLSDGGGAGISKAAAQAPAPAARGERQPPLATPPPAQPGAQLAAALTTALQQRTISATAEAVQQQLTEQLPSVKAQLTEQALADLKREIAAEVRRQVAAEVRRQVVDAVAQLQHDFLASLPR